MKKGKGKPLPKRPKVTDRMMEQLAMEGALLNGAEALRAECGDEALEAVVIELILPYEKDLRKNDPNNEALKLLDEWREENRWRT